MGGFWLPGRGCLLTVSFPLMVLQPVFLEVILDSSAPDLHDPAGINSPTALPGLCGGSLSARPDSRHRNIAQVSRQRANRMGTSDCADGRLALPGA